MRARAPRGKRRSVAAALIAACALLAATPLAAQRTADLAAYDRMSCAELEAERRFLQRDLVRMQHPSGLTDSRWTITSNAYGLTNQLIIRRCRPLSAQEQKYPAPPKVALMPEQQHVATAMRAFKNKRYEAAQAMLLQGSLAGYASAQFNLGMIFHLRGQREAAERWLRSAAQKNHPDAIRMLESIRANQK